MTWHARPFCSFPKPKSPPQIPRLRSNLPQDRAKRRQADRRQLRTQTHPSAPGIDDAAWHGHQPCRRIFLARFLSRWPDEKVWPLLGLDDGNRGLRRSPHRQRKLHPHRRSDHCRCILRRVIRARLSARRIGCQSHRLGQYHLPDRTNHQTGRRDLARLRLRLTRRAIINIQLNAKSSSYPITKERPNIFAPIIWDKALPAICRIIGDDPYLPYQNIDPRRICACMGYVLCLCTCKFALNLTHLHHLSCLKLTNPTKITA